VTVAYVATVGSPVLLQLHLVRTNLSGLVVESPGGHARAFAGLTRRTDLPAGALANATDVEPLGGGPSVSVETAGPGGSIDVPLPVVAIVYSVSRADGGELLDWGVLSCADAGGRLLETSLSIAEEGVTVRSVTCGY